MKSLIEFIKDSAGSNNSSNTDRAFNISGISKVNRSYEDSSNNSVNNVNDISILSDVSKIKKKIESSRKPVQSHNIKISDYSKKLGEFQYNNTTYLIFIY